MKLLRTVGRWAWNVACGASLLACVSACVPWARAAGTHRDRVAAAVPGCWAAVAWLQDGLQVRAVGGWPGGADVWGPAPATSVAFSVESLRPWKPPGLDLDGLAGKVRVALGPDGRPVAA